MNEIGKELDGLGKGLEQSRVDVDSDYLRGTASRIADTALMHLSGNLLKRALAVAEDIAAMADELERPTGP